jgi:hypothetical protein
VSSIHEHIKDSRFSVLVIGLSVARAEFYRQVRLKGHSLEVIGVELHNGKVDILYALVSTMKLRKGSYGHNDL